MPAARVIRLSTDAVGEAWAPNVEVHLSDTPRADPNPIVIVVPGGGYAVNAPSEALPVARWLCGAGFHAAVIFYRVSPHAWPNAVADAGRAIRLIRCHAAEFHAAPDRVGLIGFSAGGHLAGLVSFDPGIRGDPDESLGRISVRPNRLALVYPLCSLERPTHEDCVRRFLGPDASNETMRGRLSLARLVTAQAPPTLIAHASDDRTIPVEQSLELARACTTHGVDLELHVFRSGGHGFALTPSDGVAGWPTMLRHWLDGL